MAHAALAPARAVSDAAHFIFRNPWNPLSITALGRNVSAGAEMFERITRRYGKPIFGLDEIEVDGVVYPALEDVVWSRPFCNLLRFVRPEFPGGDEQPKLLIVAPMSGHYATLLRGTVEAFLPHCDVYITDWTDARMVPLAVAAFDLDDYIDYLRAMLDHLGPGVHTLGVCQPSVPLLAAVALMEAESDSNAPASMTLMGGPIDTRRSPTEVNKLAERRGVEWFRRNCLHNVPFPYAGFGREVYPGFVQLSGFMAMNLDRHVNAHLEMFNHLVKGDGDSAEKHRDFYDEYLAVMDLDAAYYMQTVETVFIRHALPKGEMTHRGQLVDLTAIRNCGLMTVEGEKDDISGIGQTYAAQELCVNIPEARKLHHLQKEVGHYGVFNGSRFRKEIAPRIREFIAMNNEKLATSNGYGKSAATVEAWRRTERDATAVPFSRTGENAPSCEYVSVKGKGPRAAGGVAHPPSRSTEFATTLDGPPTLSARMLAPPILRSGSAHTQAEAGRNCKMSDWKVLYRDDLDRDRTSGSVPSKEAALQHARDLHLRQSAEIYRIVGPEGLGLPKEEIMRWVSANKR